MALGMAHNLKVIGSNPIPATKILFVYQRVKKTENRPSGAVFCYVY